MSRSGWTAGTASPRRDPERPASTLSARAANPRSFGIVDGAPSIGGAAAVPASGRRGRATPSERALEFAPRAPHDLRAGDRVPRLRHRRIDTMRAPPAASTGDGAAPPRRLVDRVRSACELLHRATAGRAPAARAAARPASCIRVGGRDDCHECSARGKEGAGMKRVAAVVPRAGQHHDPCSGDETIGWNQQSRGPDQTTDCRRSRSNAAVSSASAADARAISGTPAANAAPRPPAPARPCTSSPRHTTPMPGHRCQSPLSWSNRF